MKSSSSVQVNRALNVPWNPDVGLRAWRSTAGMSRLCTHTSKGQPAAAPAAAPTVRSAPARFRGPPLLISALVDANSSGRSAHSPTYVRCVPACQKRTGTERAGRGGRWDVTTMYTITSNNFLRNRIFISQF